MGLNIILNIETTVSECKLHAVGQHNYVIYMTGLIINTCNVTMDKKIRKRKARLTLI